MELASLAALERTHRRHDEVVAELLDAARRFAAGRPDDGDLARVHDAVAYFEHTVTRHFVDEDGSVFPRLSTRRPVLAAALAELSAQHPTQITLQAEVARAAHALDSRARPSAGKSLLDAATKLAEVHHAHVGREDEIFATAHEALTAQDDREIVAEMEMRRDRKDHDASDRAPSQLATAEPRRRSTGTTAKLTTKRASVAGRSSAKRAATKPTARTPVKAVAHKAAAHKAAAHKAASKPTKAAANKAASKPTKAAAHKAAAKPTKAARKPSKAARKPSRPTPKSRSKR